MCDTTEYWTNYRRSVSFLVKAHSLFLAISYGLSKSCVAAIGAMCFSCVASAAHFFISERTVNMDKVEAFLRKQHKTIKEERDRVLIELGLCEKEYYQYEGYSPDYPEYEQVNGVDVHFRYVPIEVTEEQWKAIVFSVKKVEEVKEIVNQSKEGAQIMYPIRYGSNSYEDYDLAKKLDLGESNIATMIRGFGWFFAVSGVIGGLIPIDSGGIESIIFLIACILFSAVILITSHALASILDYLASLTAIIRCGFKFDKRNT